MTYFQKKQEKAFDLFFSRLGNVPDLLNESVALQLEFQTLIKFMGEIRGKRILDVGCGTGRNAIKLAMQSNTSQVIGVDISKVACDKANQIANQLNIKNFKAIQVDFSKGNYNEEFDFVLLVNVLHHTDRVDDLLINIHQCLSPSGSLIIIENNSLNPLFIPFFILIRALKEHLTLEYLKSNRFLLKKKLKSNQFEIKNIERYGYLPTMLYNYSLFFKRVNDFFNKVPLLNEFCAFYIIKCSKIPT